MAQNNGNVNQGVQRQDADVIGVSYSDYLDCVNLATREAVDASTMTSLTRDGGVRKRTLKEGSGLDNQVKEGCRVRIHYSSFLDNGPGNQMDLQSSSLQNETARSLEIRIPGLSGLQIGLQTMRKGELAEFLICPKYWYLDQRILGYIGQDLPLRIIVKLKEVKGYGDDQEELPLRNFDQVLKDVEELFQAGNAQFNKGLYKESCVPYIKALEMLNGNTGKWSDVKMESEMKMTVGNKKIEIYEKLAFSQFQLKNYEEVEKVGEAVLQLHHQRPDLKAKVLYHQAAALLELGKISDAEYACIVGLREKDWGLEEFMGLCSRIQSIKLAKKGQNETKKKMENSKKKSHK